MNSYAMFLKATISFLAITATAVSSTIVRPCSTNACVARHLASRSQCNPRVQGFVPREYLIPSFPFHTAYFNSTYIDNNLTIRNHDRCFISEFYYNLATKKAVLGLDCPMLEFQSTRTVIQHYSLRDDVIYDYSYQGTYPLIRLTLNFPYTGLIDICQVFTHADVTALPWYKIKPNNLKTANYLSKEDSLLNIFERETFFWRARELSHYYINSMLCDFGCNF